MKLVKSTPLQDMAHANPGAAASEQGLPVLRRDRGRDVRRVPALQLLRQGKPGDSQLPRKMAVGTVRDICLVQKTLKGK